MKVPPGSSLSVAVLDGPAADLIHRDLLARGGLRVARYETSSDFVNRGSAVPGPDILVVAGAVYDGQIAAHLRDSDVGPELIQVTTAGYETLERYGVPPSTRVCNAGGAWAPSVAEHALALILATCRRLDRALVQQQAQVWDRGFSEGFQGLLDSELLIIGLGNVGQNIAIRAHALGMRVTAVTPSGRQAPGVDEVLPGNRLHEALARADVVVVAVALTPQTTGLIDEAALQAMRANAVLVNVSRGPVVDSAALEAALRAGRLAGAAIDVADPEPLPADSTLWSAPRLIITPHVSGSAGARGWQRIADAATSNIMRFVTGEPLAHEVHVDAGVHR